ncbi:blue light receptor, partial [Cladochytrium tenue]
ITGSAQPAPPPSRPPLATPAGTGHGGVSMLSGIYSQTGFDLIGVLARVVHRPNPLVVVGNIDLSCAFVVTDPLKLDNPVIYASDTFFRLTYGILAGGGNRAKLPVSAVANGPRLEGLRSEVLRQLHPRDSDIWVRLSPEGLILDAVAPTRSIFGVDVDHVLGTRVSYLVVPEDWPAFERSLRSLSPSHLYDQLPCRFRTRDRTGRPDVTAAPAAAVVQLYAERQRITPHVFCRIRSPGSESRVVPLADFAINVFDVMTETRTTSLHYELNQLRVQNKRLRDEIAAVGVGGGGGCGDAAAAIAAASKRQRRQQAQPPLPLQHADQAPLTATAVVAGTGLMAFRG